jgi:hypothetical protein
LYTSFGYVIQNNLPAKHLIQINKLVIPYIRVIVFIGHFKIPKDINIKATTLLTVSECNCTNYIAETADFYLGQDQSHGAIYLKAISTLELHVLVIYGSVEAPLLFFEYFVLSYGILVIYIDR